MLHVYAYEPSGKVSKEIMQYSFWKKFDDMEFIVCRSSVEAEKLLINQNIDVLIVVLEQDDFVQKIFIQKILSNYQDVFVVIAGASDDYCDVREAFLMGAFDYLTLDVLEERLEQTLLRIPNRRRDIYFNDKIYDKVMLLARHIFDGGKNVEELVKDIVETVYTDWCNNSIVCQQVIERVKKESYNYFVHKKPWLEKFIYKGDYIRDIGFELKERTDVEKELCRYYSEVNELFKKYNVIDINKTIYTIGKCVIRQVDSKVTLESVANEVYLNKTYVSYIFKKKTGVSFNDFVIDVKVDRAKTLLHYPDMSVNMITEILNFCNAGYFSLQFKKHTGLSPTEYRQSIKK